ncbi:hypothetical protein F4820DRAFT_432288 [Hypoxylon rubiginosum]|uniref:Uncharacterized protein n=1 Tax=Hypoxylon rubiginosum TaxID=110542 RepID=A0ACB9YRM2_9PEZI|nr:hypothetical protein F4820DRAFT_432288 [Hypoxylon rubiginosum]
MTMICLWISIVRCILLTVTHASFELSQVNIDIDYSDVTCSSQQKRYGPKGGAAKNKMAGVRDNDRSFDRNNRSKRRSKKKPMFVQVSASS